MQTLEILLSVTDKLFEETKIKLQLIWRHNDMIAILRFSFQIFATKNFKIFYLMSMFPNRTLWFSAILWFSICSESSCIQIRKVSYFSCSARYDALKSKHFHSYDFQGSWHATKPKTFVLLDNNFWYKTIYSLKWHFTNFINLFNPSIFFL